MAAFAAAGLSTLAATFAHADPPPEAVWQAMKERTVVVEKDDGSTVTGKLIGVDEATVIVMTATGEPLTVQRSSVRSVRGESAEAKPPPPPPGEPAPATGVRVHIDSNHPELQLYKIEGESTVAIGTRVGSAAYYAPVCTAPCDRMIDGSRGEPFFLSAGGKMIGPRFQLLNRQGEDQITLKADIRRLPSPGLFYGGTLALGLGAAAAVGGVVLAVMPSSEYDYEGNEVQTENKDAPMFWGIAAGGGALALGGVLMMVFSRGDYDVDVPTQVAGLSLRGFAFTPPVRVGGEALPLTGHLSFTF